MPNSTVPPNTKHEDELRKAQDRAKSASSGFGTDIWSLPPAEAAQLADHGNGIGNGDGACPLKRSHHNPQAVRARVRAPHPTPGQSQTLRAAPPRSPRQLPAGTPRPRRQLPAVATRACEADVGGEGEITQ